MRNTIALLLLLFVGTTSFAQFKKTEKGLTIMVTDGSEKGKNSKTQSGNDIPTSYDYVQGKNGKGKGKVGSSKNRAKNQLVFKDPIRELGMKESIQAAAFLERPKYGKIGYMLIFCVNDAIDGQQGTLELHGKTYKGIYRLIRQKSSSKEPIPEGMTGYQIKGTFFLLGIS